MTWVAVVLIAIYAAVEGKREFKIFKLNQAADFDVVPYETQPKPENAFLFVLAAFWLGGLSFIPFALFVRWTLLDGVLNLLRKRAFFFVGHTSKIDLFLHRKLPGSASLWAAILKLVGLVVSFVIYTNV